MLAHLITRRLPGLPAYHHLRLTTRARLLFAIALTALISASLTGCGGGSGGTSTAAATSTPVATPTVATPAGVSAVLNVDFNAVPSYTAPTLPAYYDGTVTALDNTPPNNALNDRTALLGRVLFYDKRLSVNDAVSCASCHQPTTGFSDSAQFSKGFTGTAFTSAHAMRLANARYYRSGQMFWDRRTPTLEAQAIQPIINAIEMGWTPATGGTTGLINKLRTTSYYSDLFALAFGDNAITEARIGQALAQFQRALISSKSKWDTGYAAVFQPTAPNRNLQLDLPNFTVQENRGRQLFMNDRGNGGLDCAACHVPPTFALSQASGSNGLDANETITFKSPSLKNVALGGPYMHDGRFATLDQVVEHYNTGVKVGPALDPRLRAGGPNNGQPRLLNLSAADKAALVAFLRTLDDPELNADARFGDPFKR